MGNDLEEILDCQVSGFHQYRLDPPIHLEYVSRSLCRMTGYEKEELTDGDRDLYEWLVHPQDRDVYRSFLSALSKKEQTLTLEYRLTAKDGTVRWVRDTGVSKREADGSVLAGCVLTDITDLKKEQEEFRFLNETLPCGCLKYTCEAQPRVTYLNEAMADILRFPEKEEAQAQGLYEASVFLLIPMEERQRFTKYLERVRAANAPVAGEMTLLRCDGTRVRVFGWVTKTTDAQGREEFQSVCMDVTERYRAKKNEEGKRYLKALSRVYDKIFEFNKSANTVKCLYCESGSGFKRFEGVSMQMDEALESWIMDAAAKEDLDRVRAFFDDFFRKGSGEEAALPQISYRARSSDGKYRQYDSILIPVDGAVSFFCCRGVQEAEETGLMRTVKIRTFGYFDVFVDETPIAFRNEKAKELLALLVDRKGGYVSSQEAISFLWEEDPVNAVTLSRYRKVVLRLKNTLEEYGILDVIETVDGKRRIVPERIRCDLYEYLSGREEHAQLFKGSYLTNYSWAETTLGELAGSADCFRSAD